MPDERESPSAGWREVYREMNAATDTEEATRSCPDCGRTCSNVLRDVYECPEHGVFRPGGGGEGDGAPSVGENAPDGEALDATERNDATDDDRTNRTFETAA